MSRTIVCLALCVAAVAAFPSAFVQIRTFSTNALCTAGTTTPIITSVSPLDTCYPTSATASTKYELTGTSLMAWTYTGQACAGTGTTAVNTTLDSCGTGTSKYVTYSASSVYAVMDYSDNDCATLTSTQYNEAGCIGGGASGSTQINIGGKLEFCSYSAAGCTGDSDCQSISHGTCVQPDGGSGSIGYDWNAASSAHPAVALTAALVAIAAFVNKF